MTFYVLTILFVILVKLVAEENAVDRSPSVGISTVCSSGSAQFCSSVSIMLLLMMMFRIQVSLLVCPTAQGTHWIRSFTN